VATDHNLSILTDLFVYVNDIDGGIYSTKTYSDYYSRTVAEKRQLGNDLTVAATRDRQASASSASCDQACHIS